MDNVFGVEVLQPLTHANNDSSSIRWSQLWRWEFQIKFSRISRISKVSLSFLSLTPALKFLPQVLPSHHILSYLYFRLGSFEDGRLQVLSEDELQRNDPFPVFQIYVSQKLHYVGMIQLAADQQ